MSATELKDEVNQEIEEDEEDVEDADDQDDLEDQGDQDDDDNWVVEWKDGRVRVYEHPEGQTKGEVFEAFKAAASQGGFLILGEQAIRIEDVRHFGWNDGSHSPDTAFFESMQESLDGMQDRVESLTEGLGDSQSALAHMLQHQAALQAAQAQLFESVENEDALEDDDEDDEDEGPRFVHKSKKGKKPFRLK